MITVLAFRHLWVRKLRSLFLLLGFSIGVGVMIVLLSVGQAMLEQSRDVSLVGGGEITVLPEGIDVEAMRTGGISGMFFGIDRARFLTRQVFGGARNRDLIRTVSPLVEGKLLYLQRGDRTIPVRAGGEIPSRAAAVGSAIPIVSGRWQDSPKDSSYVAPTVQQLYDELDRFHLPSQPDSTWGEWHYFNVVIAEDEWWYLTYLVGGEVRFGRWGGQLLVTHRRPDGGYERFSASVPANRIAFDTAGADLVLGNSVVEQRRGRYRLRAQAGGASGPLTLELDLTPLPNRYFPPVELRDDDFVSGYVVPGLAATASGKFCVAGRCRGFRDRPGYHDHNWGVWRDVTWEWGAARGNQLNLLYGGVYGPDRNQAMSSASVRSPFFLAVVDSAGVKQVLRFGAISYSGARSASGTSGHIAPARFSLLATRGPDTLRLSVNVADASGTEMGTSGFRRVFLQMRGRFRLEGTLLGEAVADSGSGFFETYVAR
jgi:hypothetical protein